MRRMRENNMNCKECESLRSSLGMEKAKYESLRQERDRLAAVVFSHEKWIEQLQSTVKTMRDNLLARSQMGKVIELEDQLQASAAREKVLVEALSAIADCKYESSVSIAYVADIARAALAERGK